MIDDMLRQNWSTLHTLDRSLATAFRQGSPTEPQSALFSESERGGFPIAADLFNFRSTPTLRIAAAWPLVYRADCHCVFAAESSVFETCF